MAFYPKYVQGATLNQIQKSLNYSAFLMTPEQLEELKQEKKIDVKIDTDWKEVSCVKQDVSNEVVYPAGPVGVPREPTPPQRITGTNN